MDRAGVFPPEGDGDRSAVLSDAEQDRPAGHVADVRVGFAVLDDVLDVRHGQPATANDLDVVVIPQKACTR